MLKNLNLRVTLVIKLKKIIQVIKYLLYINNPFYLNKYEFYLYV